MWQMWRVAGFASALALMLALGTGDVFGQKKKDTK